MTISTISKAAGKTVATLPLADEPKANIIDNDNLLLMDSEDGSKSKLSTLASVKSFLKKYFDNLYNWYEHPVGDGNLHVPATGTVSKDKVLVAGSTAGSLSWRTVSFGGDGSDLGPLPSASYDEAGVAQLATNTEALTGAVDNKIITPASLKVVLNNSSAIPDATATGKGIVELATAEETVTGTDTHRAVTPASLNAKLNCTVTMSSADQAVDSPDVVWIKRDSESGSVSIPKMAAATQTSNGVIRLATNAEVLAGDNTVKAVTPATLQAKLDEVSSFGINDIAVVSPLKTTGGSTPTLSMPAATNNADGYMTSAQATTLETLAANSTHTGDVTGSSALTISDKAVSLPKLADIPSATLIGRVSSGTGTPETLTRAQAQQLLNVADGATAYVLPVATAFTLGGVKVGDGLTINNGVLSSTGTGASSNGVSGTASSGSSYSSGAVKTYVNHFDLTSNNDVPVMWFKVNGYGTAKTKASAQMHISVQAGEHFTNFDAVVNRNGNTFVIDYYNYITRNTSITDWMAIPMGALVSSAATTSEAGRHNHMAQSNDHGLGENPINHNPSTTVEPIYWSGTPYYGRTNDGTQVTTSEASNINTSSTSTSTDTSGAHYHRGTQFELGTGQLCAGYRASDGLMIDYITSGQSAHSHSVNSHSHTHSHSHTVTPAGFLLWQLAIDGRHTHTVPMYSSGSSFVDKFHPVFYLDGTQVVDNVHQYNGTDGLIELRISNVSTSVASSMAVTVEFSGYNHTVWMADRSGGHIHYKYAAIGDSIVEAVNADNNSTKSIWCDMLGIASFGISGQRTDQILSRMQKTVSSLSLNTGVAWVGMDSYSHIILEGGVNDVWQQVMSPGSFTYQPIANIDSMVQMVKSCTWTDGTYSGFKTPVILLAPPLEAATYLSKVGGATIAQLNEISTKWSLLKDDIVAYATANGVQIVDWFTPMLTPAYRADLSYDGIHPNFRGYCALASIMHDAVSYHGSLSHATASLPAKSITATYVNVKDYGAKGDGVTDDTSAMQAAHSTGKVVFYPDGEYVFSNISMTSGGIVGAGPSTTILHSTAPSGNTILFNPVYPLPALAVNHNTYPNDEGYFTYIAPTFKDIQIRCPDQTSGRALVLNPTGPQHYGHEAIGAEISNIVFKDTNVGLWVDGAGVYANVTNCKFLNYRYAGFEYQNDGWPDSGTVSVSGSHFSSYIGYNTASGILHHGGGGLNVVNSNFCVNKHAYKFTANADCAAEDNYTNNVWFSNCMMSVSWSYDIYFEKIGSWINNVSNITITNNQMASIGFPATTVDGGANQLVANNVLIANNLIKYIKADLLQNFTVSNNTFIDAASNAFQSGSGGTYSVEVGSGATNGTVFNNAFLPAAGESHIKCFSSTVKIYDAKYVENTAATGNVDANRGGTLTLEKQSGSTLSGTGVTIDQDTNKVRFFENGGTFRGAYLDIAEGGAGAASKIVTAANISSYLPTQVFTQYQRGSASTTSNKQYNTLRITDEQYVSFPSSFSSTPHVTVTINVVDGWACSPISVVTRAASTSGFYWAGIMGSTSGTFSINWEAKL